LQQQPLRLLFSDESKLIKLAGVIDWRNNIPGSVINNKAALATPHTAAAKRWNVLSDLG